MIRRFLLNAAAWAALFALAAPAAARPVTAEDLFKIQLVATPRISHDGEHVAFVVTKLDGPKNTYLSNIWIAEVKSGRVWQLTRGEKDDSPAWSPDNRTIAFVSGRHEKSQVYRISITGGEAQRLTNLPDGASNPQWSHEGTRILFMSATKDEQPPARIYWRAAGFTPKEDQRKSDVRTIDVLPYESNGEGYTYNLHQHIWVVNTDGNYQRALTSGHRWSESNPSWSPDDKTIAFNTYRGYDPYLLAEDVYTIPVSGGQVHELPLSHKSSDTPTWSHDGRELFYYITSSPDPAAMAGVAKAAADGTNEHTVVPEDQVQFGETILTDLSNGGNGCGPLLEPHDRWFIAEVSRPEATALVKFDTSTGKADTVVSAGDDIGECSMSDDGLHLALVKSDAVHPPELFIADTTSGTPRRLTDFNDDYLKTVTVSRPEPIVVKDKAGFEVHAEILHPPNFVAGRRYPTLLEIHGGPELEYGNTFFHEFQQLAGLGYNVVYADPRGSSGFGYRFEAALSKNWGDPMFEDEMAVMDAVVKRPEVDASRLGVLGGSYGGYSTLWVIGHTHRFKAAVAMRTVSNFVNQTLAFDFPSANSEKFSFGDSWNHSQLYWRLSPVAYVKNVTTPLLLIHGDDDLRTPLAETQEEYSALKILGRTVEMAQFPRENHDLSRVGEPIHRVEEQHLIADWFKKYLRP